MKSTTLTLFFLAVSVILLLLPDAALACGSCYGAADSPQTNGLNYAILSMIGVTGGVLAAMTSFFLYLRKQARKFVEGEPLGIAGSENGGND